MKLVPLLHYGIIIGALVLMPLWSSAQNGARAAEDAADRQIAIRAASSLTLENFTLLEGPISDQTQVKVKTLIGELFGPQPPGVVPGSNPKLMRIEHTTSSENGTGYRDTMFTYEVTLPDQSKHTTLVTIRHYENGTMDYSIAAGHEIHSSFAAPEQSRYRKTYKWMFLALTILVPFFILSMAFLCFVTRPKFRIVWLIFIFLGIGRVDFDWLTGTLNVLPVQMIFFGFHINGEMLSVAFPLGAFVFYICWRSGFFKGQKSVKTSRSTSVK